MRKAVALLTVALASTVLAACGTTKTTTVTSTVTRFGTPTTTAATTTTATTTPASGPVNKTCNVTGVPNVTTGSVSVQLTATGATGAAVSLVGCPTASTLVKIVAGTKAQMPVKTKSFNCTPTVNGTATSFDCTLLAANQGSVEYKFTLNYKA